MHSSPAGQMGQKKEKGTLHICYIHRDFSWSIRHLHRGQLKSKPLFFTCFLWRENRKSLLTMAEERQKQMNLCHWGREGSIFHSLWRGFDKPRQSDSLAMAPGSLHLWGLSSRTFWRCYTIRGEKKNPASSSWRIPLILACVWNSLLGLQAAVRQRGWPKSICSLYISLKKKGYVMLIT